MSHRYDDDGWIARNFILDRPDQLRLSVSLGDRDGGFADPTWCWFVYDLKHKYKATVAKGTAADLEEAKFLAAEYADRLSGRVCTLCGLTEAETQPGRAHDSYCDVPTDGQHHFPPWKQP